ncbi:MAG: guanylate kinase [Verrucomicrobia bacterium]|nr:guanylate kinase [Verrucomicrobiota bacterium]|tara:strand:+ start:830 stop:1393 length:564 start_codon:yes stop_codon:yes gene_type:complete
MGKCIIFSAPSGAGKTTLVKHLLSQIPELSFSISACTRKKRGNEVDGKDYYFLEMDAFKKRIQEDAFVEWEEVYIDHYYGTLKSEIVRIWKAGKTVIFDVDVVGGLNLKKYFGKQAFAVFVMPPDMVTLEKRLRGRATDQEDKIAQRLKKAKEEIETAHQFDYILKNHDLDLAKKESYKIVTEFIKS